MKPETASALYSLEQAYKYPELYTPDEVIDTFEEYGCGLYMRFNFTFIYCLRKPVYIDVDNFHTDTVNLYGGKYLIESYDGYYSDNCKHSWIIDTDTYPFSDTRPFYKGYGRVIDFTDSSIKGIIINPLSDWHKDHSRKISDEGLLKFNGEGIRTGPVSVTLNSEQFKCENFER